MYTQHVQPQAQYGSPVYMQQVYSPQQQYPVYPVVSPSWSPSIMPYFETPLVSASVFISLKSFLYEVIASLQHRLLQSLCLYFSWESPKFSTTCVKHRHLFPMVAL